MSSVDHETEKKMITALFKDSQRPTLCLISQRISALEKCDQILVLENGSIIDQGNHMELLEKSSTYSAAYSYQKLVQL